VHASRAKFALSARGGTCVRLADMVGCENEFLKETGERSDLNQYWYSRPTIDALVAEIVQSGGSAALVSTPSVYFSLPEDARQRCKVLDYDRQWESDPGYVFYDFNAPVDLPPELRGAFDFVLVDPPFITHEVWTKYAETTRFLVREGGRILCTTINENDGMMQELLGTTPVLFRPSIPNLVYQYSVYTNYSSEGLARLNPEIDDCDWRAVEPKQCAKQERSLPTLLPGESAAIGGKLPAGLGAEAAVVAALAAEAAGGSEVIDARAPPPGAVLLTELRERLGCLKRTTEAVFVPVQQGVRRPSAVGRPSPAAERALDAADVAALDAREWLVGHRAELAAVLGETEEAVLASDRWRIEAVLGVVSAAKGGALKDMTAYQEWANIGREHSVELFKMSSSLLDRIKALKREAAAAADGA